MAMRKIGNTKLICKNAVTETSTKLAGHWRPAEGNVPAFCGCCWLQRRFPGLASATAHIAGAFCGGVSSQKAGARESSFPLGLCTLRNHYCQLTTAHDEKGAGKERVRMRKGRAFPRSLTIIYKDRLYALRLSTFTIYCLIFRALMQPFLCGEFPLLIGHS